MVGKPTTNNEKLQVLDNYGAVDYASYEPKLMDL